MANNRTRAPKRWEDSLRRDTCWLMAINCSFPCGAGRPATFDRQSGELLDFTLPSEGAVPGGWFMRMDPKVARDIRRGKIEFDSVVNRDLHEGGLREGKGVAGSRTQVTLAGTLLKYADGVKGVDGDIHSVVAANGRLFVTTHEGTIYCFGDIEVSPIFHPAQSAPKPDVDKALASTIAHLRTLTPVRDGYALVLGTRDGRLAEHLAAETNFQVIALAPVESDAEAIRRRILDPAAPAGRLSIASGQLEEVAFPQYLADLIVAEDWGVTRLETGADFLLTLYERLKPYGGVACLNVDRRVMRRFGRGSTKPGIAKPRLNAAATSCSSDGRARCPAPSITQTTGARPTPAFGLLWVSCGSTIPLLTSSAPRNRRSWAAS